MASFIRLLLRVALVGGALAALPSRASAQIAPGDPGTIPRTRLRSPRPPTDRPRTAVEQAAASDADDRSDLELLPVEESAPTAPLAVEPDRGVAPDFLESLPHPADQPRSLFQPAPALGPPPPDLESPYFQEDPLLDPPQWGATGWFFDVQVSGIKPHVQNEMFEVVTTGLGASVPVQLGNSPLNWTAAPRVEFGYRLPSGFGAFAIADSAFVANGADIFRGPDGPAPRTTSLQMNYTDLDYISREYTPCADWDMRWRAGARISETFSTTDVVQSFAQAAAGSGILAAQQSNATLGAGPHFAVELDRWLHQASGLGFLGKVDIADNFSVIRQRFSATTTELTSSGAFDSGVKIDRFENQIVILTVQLGVTWQPPRYPNSRVDLGWIQQTWWNVMQNAESGFPTSSGQFDYQGVFLRASWNY